MCKEQFYKADVPQGVIKQKRKKNQIIYEYIPLSDFFAVQISYSLLFTEQGIPWKPLSHQWVLDDSHRSKITVCNN